MKKALSIVLALFLAVALVVPFSTVESNAAFKVRSKMPEFGSAEGKAFYYTDDNVFYKNNYGPNKKYLVLKGGYVSGNCTWYAYGRASEILGKPLNSNFRWGADNWWSVNEKGNYYKSGSEPKVGAIACYSNHVAIVEKIVNGKVYVSESGWTISKKCPQKASDLKFNYGTPWKKTAKGYIYITESISLKNAKDVSYSVQVTASDLNLRAGPGTSYSRIGYAKKGIHEVVQECGNWVKLKSNEYWVCASYVKKVEPVVETPVEEEKAGSTTANDKNDTTTEDVKETPADTSKPVVEPNVYQVKVTASELNMRTGPGTKYKSKGTLKKNKVCEIKAEKNGWGQISSNGYWIKLSYTKKIDTTTATSKEYKVKVKAKDLNMRTGPGTSYKKKGFIKPGTYIIIQTSNGWGKVKTNGYWIKLSYTTKI